MSSTFAQSLQAKRTANDVLLGSFVFSRDPTMCEVYAACGFDFVIVDMEHGLNDVGTAIGHVRASRAAGMQSLVRVGAANLGDVARLLDAGCEGVVIPHFGMGLAAVDEAVHSLRYHPAGSRPTCTGVAAADFGLGIFAQKAERSNAQVVSVGLIEDRQAVERIDAVLDSAAVDWVMPGPGDLATSLGVHGQLRHPTVEAAVDRIFEAATTRGKPVGMYINDPSELAAWHAKGAGFFVLSIDYKWLAKSLDGAAKACRAALSARSAA
jgi:2-keto-3-deoxy-L-rhamnonate aldolase RhmA